MLCWGNYVKCATCKKHRSSTKYGWQLISKWFYFFLRHKEVDEGMSLTWKLITDWSRHGDVFDRLKCLTWKALAVVKYHYNYATGEPVSAESSSEHQGFFFLCQQRQAMDKCSPLPFNGLSGKGKCLSFCDPCHLWWANSLGCCDAGVCSSGIGFRHIYIIDFEIFRSFQIEK